jgi:hypothetical protein
VSQSHRTKSEFKWLPISALNGDPAYQRSLNEKRVQHIADEFDPDAFGVITVSKREDGTYWVIDGQHRLAALRRMGWKDTQQVACNIFSGLSRQQEAGLFSKIDDYLNLGYLDRFRARVESGEQRAVAIEHIIRNAGFTVSKLTGPGNLSAVQACEFVYTGRGTRTSGRDHAGELKATLENIRAAWGLSPDGVRGPIIQGIGRVFLRDGDAIDRANLSSKLASFEGGPEALIGLAKGLKAAHGGRVTDAVSELVIATYNKGRRVTKLEAWR